MNFWITIVLVVALMALVFLALAIQVIFKKTHEFPNTHIGSNEHLKEKGVTCATTWDRIEQRDARKKDRFRKLTISK